MPIQLVTPNVHTVFTHSSMTSWKVFLSFFIAAVLPWGLLSNLSHLRGIKWVVTNSSKPHLDPTLDPVTLVLGHLGNSYYLSPINYSESLPIHQVSDRGFTCLVALGHKKFLSCEEGWPHMIEYSLLQKLRQVLFRNVFNPQKEFVSTWSGWYQRTCYQERILFKNV